ncbi:tRNA (guanosine(37)-N1)-methyltransferase TrmD [bacterium]|nr:tRNA (guanosine(37)-N1)-methyltransferase TrmD [bacterium]MCI0602374.1 tRNA (guanosine(37)-N1)-methyltransferase TrmD [bacterium]
MRIDFLTIFPEIFTGILNSGLIRHGREKGLLEVGVRDLRNYTHDRHRSVDDVPYGGGPGMVFMPGPIFEAIESLDGRNSIVILPSPQGQLFTQEMAEELAGSERLLFICARYEGVDERVCEELVDREISIGDFVTMGGELPALVMMEAIVRFIPGMIGQRESVANDSFQESLLDFPHYTRPEDIFGARVPEVLLSGNHEEIRKWRRKMALKRTWERRPELLKRASLSAEDKRFLEEIKKETTDEHR